MARPERKLTYEDYLHFPDGERWELIDGEAMMVPSPNTRHQDVIGRLYLRIGNHVERHGDGRVFVAPYDVVLTDVDVLQPDLVFISEQDAGVITEANVRGTPTWCIEVGSPSHPERDRVLKLRRYESARVPEYWIVDPAEDTLTVLLLAGEAYGDPVVLRAPSVARPRLPRDLDIDLAYLFAR